MLIKTLAAVSLALCLGVFSPSLYPCQADLTEAAPAASDPAAATGKVLVVLVYDQHCKVWCTQVRPIIRELAAEYGDKVHVEEIDNSPSSAAAALKQVKELDILAFYKDVEAVPTLLIFDVKRKQCKEIWGPKKKEVYKEAIDKLIAKGQ